MNFLYNVCSIDKSIESCPTSMKEKTRLTTLLLRALVVKRVLYFPISYSTCQVHEQKTSTNISEQIYDSKNS